MYHTIGQRQGLGIGGRSDHPEAPWYVVEKRLATNTLVVAQGNQHPTLFRDKLLAAEVMWISGEAPRLPFSCHAKIRYRQPDQACVISQQDKRLVVSFEAPQRPVTPGQSVVFYEGEVCLGCGVFEAAL